MGGTDSAAAEAAPITIESETGRVLVGTIHALQASIARARVARGGCPLSVGSRVIVRLEAPGLPAELSATAIVVDRSEGETERRYGLRVPTLGDRGGGLTASLHARFNRRQAHRVRPEPLHRVSVDLSTGAKGPEARVTLGDISTGGAGLQVSSTTETRFADIESVRLAVRLPDIDEPLQLQAEIRSRHLVGTQVRWGLCFDESGPATRAALADYVRRRRHEAMHPTPITATAVAQQLD